VNTKGKPTDANFYDENATPNTTMVSDRKSGEGNYSKSASQGEDIDIK